MSSELEYKDLIKIDEKNVEVNNKYYYKPGHRQHSYRENDKFKIITVLSLDKENTKKIFDNELSKLYSENKYNDADSLQRRYIVDAQIAFKENDNSIYFDVFLPDLYIQKNSKESGGKKTNKRKSLRKKKRSSSRRKK